MEYKYIILIVMACLSLVSIVVNICVLRELRKASNKSVGSAIKNGLTSASQFLSQLDITKVGDVVGLVKDLVKKPTADDTKNDTEINNG